MACNSSQHKGHLCLSSRRLLGPPTVSRLFCCQLSDRDEVPLLFVSDIRTADWQRDSAGVSEKRGGDVGFLENKTKGETIPKERHTHLVIIGGDGDAAGADDEEDEEDGRQCQLSMPSQN